MNSVVMQNEVKRIHPHKFTLWVAMGSIVMMFAGLTSAYIVKKSQSNWLQFALPTWFWYSTIVILVSSATMYISLKSFKAREMQRYRTFVTITAILGIVFTLFQLGGFYNLEARNIPLFGPKSNSATSFLGVISGLHMLHVLGGVIALIVIMIRAYVGKTKSYSVVPIEVVSTYWHFVDILWIYLFVFFNLMQQ